MKKILCFILCIMLLTSVIAGCTTAQPSEPTGIQENSTPPTDNQKPQGNGLTQPRLCKYAYQRIDDCGRSDTENSTVITVRSVTELDDYSNQNADALNARFLTAVKEYDSDFFTDHTLLLLPLHSTTYHHEHKVTNVVEELNGDYTVYLDWISPELNSPATNSWYVIIAVEGCIAKDVQVNLVIDRIQEPSM